MRSYIFGVGLIIAGCIGVAIGNLEETVYYTSEIGSEAGDFRQSPAYYMFWAYIIIGFGSMITDQLKKKKKKR